MALIAAFYLRRRSLPMPHYLAWGALLVFVPFLGPFLVILSAPGSPRLSRLLATCCQPAMKPDRFLWALLIGIGVLVVAALAFFFLRRERQDYGPDDTPKNVVRNYALALQKLDYARAYDLLQEAEDKPDFERFQAQFPHPRR